MKKLAFKALSIVGAVLNILGFVLAAPGLVLMDVSDRLLYPRAR
jgi:hypothetical protein